MGCPGSFSTILIPMAHYDVVGLLHQNSYYDLVNYKSLSEEHLYTYSCRQDSIQILGQTDTTVMECEDYNTDKPTQMVADCLELY